MTTTPPEAPPEPGPEQPSGPRTTREEVRDLGRLRRSTTDRKVAGVAGGLARHLDVDPVILRVAFVVLVFFGGAGLIVYGAAWLLVPQDDATEAPFHLDERNRTVALTIVGVVAVLSMLGDSWGVFSFPWPLAIVALVALFLLDRSDRSRRRAAAAVSPAPYAAAPPAPYAAAPPAPYAAAPPAPYAAPTSGPVPPPGTPGTAWGPAPTQPYAAAQPPAYAPPPPPPVAPNPRRRGPVLFWFTLALAALGVAVLGLLDMGGMPVADAAYPALVVATCGVMLLVGAFFGRAGGLIAVGLVAAVAMAATAAAGEVEGSRVEHRPASAAGLASSYDLGVGEMVIDLTDIGDLDELDGRNLLLEGGIGRIEVIVPPGLDLTGETTVGIGNSRVLGEDHGGFGVERDVRGVSGSDPLLTVDAHLGIGQIEIHTAFDDRVDRSSNRFLEGVRR